MTRKRGRPSRYDPNLAEKILAQLSDGRLLIEICREPWAPGRSTLYRWQEHNPEFRDAFARARELQAHACAELAVETARNATPETANSARLRHDGEKWFASKMMPRIYGDTARREVTGANGGPIDFRNLTTEQITDILNRQATAERDQAASGGAGASEDSEP